MAKPNVKITLDPEVTAAARRAFGVGPDHVHTPRYFGPQAGIRCQKCNAVIEPDPRVSQTAAAPWTPNTEAVSAAVTARGGRCLLCWQWTFSPADRPSPGRLTREDYCGPCAGIGDDTQLIKLTGLGEVSARFLTETDPANPPTAAQLDYAARRTLFGPEAARHDPSAVLPAPGESHRYVGGFGPCEADGCGRTMGDIRHRPEDLSERLLWKTATMGEHYGIRRDPSADALAATWEEES